jgi:hypothetical protein
MTGKYHGLVIFCYLLLWPPKDAKAFNFMTLYWCFLVCDVNVIVHSHKRLVGLILKLFMVAFFCRVLELFGFFIFVILSSDVCVFFIHD